MRTTSVGAIKQVAQALLETVAVENRISAAEELFALADLGREQPRLVQALTDPARTVSEKETLLETTGISGQLSSVVRQATGPLFGITWQNSADLVEAWEELGFGLLTKSLAESGKLSQIQDELFELSKFLLQHRGVRVAISDAKQRYVAQRVKLAGELFGSQIDPICLTMLERAIKTVAKGDGHGELRSVTSRLRYYQERLSAESQSRVAIVRSAVELTSQQQDRLKQILSQREGCPVVLNISIEPELLGGMQIECDSYIYDGTVQTALKQTKQNLAGSSL